MKYKAIIFDLDGTIIDTGIVWEKATKDLIAGKGCSLSAEQGKDLQQKIYGLALNKSCAIIKDFVGLDCSVSDLIKEKQKLASDRFNKTDIGFVKGFGDFHASVCKLGLKTGIATNAPDETLDFFKSKFKLNSFFREHIYNVSDVKGVCKPDPALYLYAADKLGVDPSECVVVEDSAHGVAAAKAAGMFCIGINTSKDSEAIKKSDFIVDDYRDIDFQRLFFTLSTNRDNNLKDKEYKQL